MKKNILIILCSICLYLCQMQTVVAIPAYPHPLNVKLPDGSYITLRIYGDEYYHYKTTVDGYMVEQSKDGYYYYTHESGSGVRTLSKVRAHNPAQRTSQELLSLGRTSKAVRPSHVVRQLRQDKMNRMNRVFKAFNATGTPKVLILLVNFQDVKFTVPNPQQAFDALSNQTGYSENGAIGSARDYFRDNSQGKFDPEFVVYGPVTVSQNVEYYGGNDAEGNDLNPGQMVLEACKEAANSGLDLKQFDTDNDGVLDNVFIYYAGHNEAELADASTIWPHRFSLGGVVIPGSDLAVADYACTSELKNASGNEMCGIGTFCHEFSHVLGLMDAYDTDYDVNGRAGGLFSLSLMSTGGYNNNGKVPPYMNVVERSIIGWMEFKDLMVDGEYSLSPVNDNEGYRIATNNDGEYFALENRDMSSKWDQYIDGEDKGDGLLIYHVDRSLNEVLGNTARKRWEDNTLNAVASHPCFRFIPAQGDVNYTPTAPGRDMFYPGSANVVSRNFVAWSGEILPDNLKNITLQGKKICFKYNSEPVYAERIELTLDEVQMDFLETKQLMATVLPVDANDRSVVWKSLNPTIAEVNEEGVVTGVGVGTATITATSGDGKASANCTVVVMLDELHGKEIMIGQREVQVKWTAVDKIQNWIVQWKRSKDNNFRMMESDTTFCIINMLEPNTVYDLQILGKIEGKTTGVLIEKSFQTNALTGEFAYINGIRQPFKEGEEFWPVVNDIQKNIRRITWKFDGKVFPYTRNLILPAGKHELKVEILTTDGIKETIVRQINVEPKKK